MNVSEAERAAQGQAAQQQQDSTSQILNALTSTLQFSQVPKPTLLRLWQLFHNLWNDSCK